MSLRLRVVGAGPVLARVVPGGPGRSRGRGINTAPGSSLARSRVGPGLGADPADFGTGPRVELTPGGVETAPRVGLTPWPVPLASRPGRLW